MIPISQALAHILGTARLRPTILVPLDQAIGKILREPIYADRDFPPGNRVTMDGIAIQYASWEQGIRSFPVQEVQVAGAPAATLQDSASCLEIMTGAMHGPTVDTVIRYEDIRIEDRNGQQIAHIEIESIKPRQNVHFQGTDCHAEDLLMEPGLRISAPEIGIAASVGKANVLVSAPPRIAIISTGDELVDIPESPLPYQIRRSNSYTLQAALRELGVDTADLYHLVDSKELIRRELEKILATYDTVILSGGVSMGKADFVPVVLKELGVEKIFHKIAQRPGKPMWFGIRDQVTVFGLPGNPVSSFVSFHRYIQPWLWQSLGRIESPLPTAVLATDVEFRPALTYFMQVSIHSDPQGHLVATPEQGHGSGDHRNLLLCDAFLQLPPDRNAFSAGEVFPLIRYRKG